MVLPLNSMLMSPPSISGKFARNSKFSSRKSAHDTKHGPLFQGLSQVPHVFMRNEQTTAQVAQRPKTALLQGNGRPLLQFSEHQTAGMHWPGRRGDDLLDAAQPFLRAHTERPHLRQRG